MAAATSATLAKFLVLYCSCFGRRLTAPEISAALVIEAGYPPLFELATCLDLFGQRDPRRPQHLGARTVPQPVSAAGGRRVKDTGRCPLAVVTERLLHKVLRVDNGLNADGSVRLSRSPIAKAAHLVDHDPDNEPPESDGNSECSGRHPRCPHGRRLI